jgi:hypothetical protein
MFGFPNPYLIGGVSLVIAGAIGFGAIQTARLNHAKADLADTRAELVKAAGALRTASEAIRGRDALLIENGAHEASDAGEMAQLMRGSTRDAFQAGRASVRCDGSQPVGVRDLRALQSAGAFHTPPRSLPGKPSSPNPR